MKNLVRANVLASAVCVALAGTAALVADAQAVQLTSSQQATGRETYFIRFSEEGVLHYQGGVSGIAATAAATDATARKLDVHSAAAVNYIGYLAAQRATHLAAIESALGRTLAVSHTYAITQNGAAAELSADEAARIASVPGVQSVQRAGFERQVTFRGPKFIGADKIWDGSATPANVGTQGQGIIVGDLDGGTASAHPSFADDPTCGFGPTQHKLKAVDCSSSANGLCNGTNAEANAGYGHGVHTSSTAAGNTIDNSATPAPALPDGVTMSGVAPCATLYHYKVCQTNTCASADILAGIENAIADQVDAVNFSISGGTSPWADADRSFLDMVNANIFVAAAAGNLQPGETDPVAQVNHRGPWVLSVAASSQDEVLSPVLRVTGPGTPPASVAAIPLIPGSTTTSTPALSGEPLKSYPGNLIGCTANGGIPAGTFTGAIAVLQRGTCSFTEKITNAAGAGAVMVVIGNNALGSISMDTTGAPNVPAYSVNQGPGNALIAFVGSNPTDSVGDVQPSAIGDLQGDVLADFSYRGPTPSPLQDLTKPDISGPGVTIYAALDPASGNYGLDSGTSMSTPHLTGSGALLRAVHPDWTPMQIKSALQTTATIGFKEDGVAPWTIDDVGSGRVDLTKAAKAGLTLDETYAHFLAANPSGGSVDVRDLNLASVRNLECSTTCTWTRTVKNSLAANGSWNASYAPVSGGATYTVSPASFTLAAGATQLLTITATPDAAATVVSFGNIVLTEANGAAPEQHLTAVVQGGGTAPPTTALCDAGACVLKLDNHQDSDPSINALGAGAGTTFVYLNRFTPDTTDYPFTLTNVQTLFVGELNDGSIGAAVGELFDAFVYQDDDNDPSNGATLVAAVHDIPVADPLGAIQTIALPAGGVDLTGPGDVLIAFQYHGATGGSPATGDISGVYQMRSYIGTIHGSGNGNRPNGDSDTIFKDGFDPAPTGPDLASENIVLVSQAPGTFTHNFIIRGNGVKPGGQPVNLGAVAR